MGAPLAITRMDHDAAGLRRLAAASSDGAQVRRLLALAMVLDGHTRTEAAERNGMDRQTLRDWVHRYNQAGVDGLLSRSAPGPTPLLTPEQMNALRDVVIAGPDHAVHGVIRWRCVDLRAEVKRRFEVSVHESTIGKWLAEMRLTRLQPRPYHPRKDAEAEAVFKKVSALG
jgi:transposase